MNWLNLNANSKQWVIKIVNDDFLVGVLDRKNKKFDPICRCEFYDQADLIRAALEHYIYAKNYTSKTYVSRQLADLLHKKIILRLAYEPGKTPVYAFCTNVAEWDGACIDLQALADNDRDGLYECAPEDCSDKANEEGWGLSDQISYGLSNRIRVGLSDQTTPNQPQITDTPAIVPVLKTIIKKIKEKELYSSETLQYQLSELLLLKILEHLPGYKKPDLQKWAKSMDSILRLDKRPAEEVKAVIIFAQGDP